MTRAQTASGSRTGGSQYDTPALIEYGTIAKLTQGSRSTMNDGMGAGGFKKSQMMCL